MKEINVTRSSMPPYEEYCEEIKSIWDTVHLTNMGPIHNRLKEQVAHYLKVPHLELFANGHLALYCAIKALDLQGEIITTPFTFASTVNAIVQAGCTPIFCEIKPDYTINEQKIEALITNRTSAVLGVHVYGNLCNVDAIQAIANKYGLKVLYDAAHAFGVEYRGNGIGIYGDISMFSFHATKVFHTIEGGALTYRDITLTTKIALQRNFGINGESLDCFGTNAKMNEFQAAMGICNLRHLDKELALRQIAFEQYQRRLCNIRGLYLPYPMPEFKRNYAYYPVLLDPSQFGMDRDMLAEQLAKQNIFARKYFYPLASENRSFKVDMSENTPIAKKYSRNILCLPLYAELSPTDIDRICDQIQRIKESS